MTFGPVGSVDAIKDSLEGSGDGVWIKGIPEGTTTVRFLQEPSEWFMYRERYEPTKKRFWPVLTEDEEWYTDEEGKNRRATLRYLTNVLLVEDDRVVPLKVPKTLAEALITRYERYKTITDRDYDLIRSGKGLNTSYDALSDEKLKRNLSQYDLHDLEEVLMSARDEVKGDDDAWGGQPLGESTIRDGDPDEKPFVAPESDEAELDTYTEEELGSMAIGQLRALAKDFDIAHDRSTNKATLIEFIMEAQ